LTKKLKLHEENHIKKIKTENVAKTEGGDWKVKQEVKSEDVKDVKTIKTENKRVSIFLSDDDDDDEL
jgi:hypothetical protein